MADFVNTIDVLGDDAVIDSIIQRTIAEFKDNRISTVERSAFQKCVNLATVDLPSAVTINYGSFNGCNALTSVNIPAVTRIEPYNAFSSCKALSKIVLPVCTNIGNGAFSYCTALKMVDCKATGSLSIGNSAFDSSALKALVIRSNSVANLDNKNALLGTEIYYGTGYIYVPTALADSYKAAANWSTYAEQFRNLEEWTVDGTVTGELDIENRHMVRFYNSDGTLLGYQIVATGASATYTGTPVYPDDSSWEFKGFEPAPTNVTEDMDCYAQYQEPFSLETASWARISEISNEGTAANYMNVGDTKSVYLNGTVGTLALDTTLYVYVLGINHNSEVEGSGIHFGTFKDAGGKDVCLVDSAYGTSLKDGTKSFNIIHWDGYCCSWSRSDVRYDILGSTDVPPQLYGSRSSDSHTGYDATGTCAKNPVPNTLMSCLPAELRDVMKPISKWTKNVYGNPSDASCVTATIDYLPLLAEFEVFGTRTNAANTTEQNNQKQYEYFANGNLAQKYKHSDNTATAYYFMRSPAVGNKFVCCNLSGGSVGMSDYYVGGIAPTFMV